MKPIEKLNKKERFKVYREAIKFYQGKRVVGDCDREGSGICIILPMIYWNMTNCLDKRPDTNKDWYYPQTTTWFPEIPKNVGELVCKVDYSIKDAKTLKRIEILKTALKS